MLLVAYLLAAFAHAVLFLLTATTLAPLAKVHIEHMVLGFGWKLVSFTARGRIFELRVLPVSAYAMAYGLGLEYQGVPPEALAEELRRRGVTDAVPWYQAPRVARALALAVAPRLASFVVASAVLGFRGAFDGVARGTAGALRGAVHPLSAAPAILASGQEALIQRGLVIVATLAMCVLIGVSLLCVS
jgi:hypothetical protein